MLWRRLFSSALAGLVPMALIACGGSQPAADPRSGPPLVQVASVQPAQAGQRAFTGTVAARVQSDLGFRVPGKVLTRLVNTGQTVRRGDVLMRIDPVDLGLTAQAQQESVAAAQARAKQTADDEGRYRDLVLTGAVSASAYDQAKAAAEAARAQLNAATAQAAVARNASRYADLLADADGVVMETLAEPGQVVAVGQVVVRVAHAGRREAIVQLPETLRPAIGSSAQATLFGRERSTVPVRLRQLSDFADRLTRTFEARYVLEGELASAPLGATVTLQLPGSAGATAAAVQVPLAALFDRGQGPGVWVIDSAPDRVSWRAVAVQGLQAEVAHVAGPLKVGDRVVALGPHLLRDGEIVRTATRSTTAATAGAER